MGLKTVCPLERMVIGGPPPAVLTTQPFQSQSTPDLTNSLLIPVEMYVYSITSPLILMTSPAAILNLPINSFCPLDTALILSSDNFLLNIPPSLPLSQPLVASLKNSLVTPSLLCVHIHSLSSDLERRL